MQRTGEKRLTDREKYYIKSAIAMAVFVAMYFAFSGQDTILGGSRILLSVVPSLIILRFLWGDVWGPVDGAGWKGGVFIVKWIVFPIVALAIILAAYLV